MTVLAEKLNSDNSIVDILLAVDPEHYNEMDLPRKVGFDKVTVGLRVEQVNWDVLEAIETSEAGSAHTLSLYSCRNEEKILSACVGEPQRHWYSSVRIQLASNVFTMKKCNLPNCRDICHFEICIPPIEGHECLGNISNLSCEQELLRVQSMMDELERYGIYVDRNYAELKKAEINVNLFLTAENVNFRDAVELLRPHRHGLSNFEFSDFARQVDDKEYYIILGPLQVSSLGINVRNRTSFNSIGRSLAIKVYDKSAETVKKSGGYIDGISPLTRVEFSINSPNEIPFYFGTENLFEMTQADVENAFHRLADRFIRIPMLEYYRKVTAGFEKCFEAVDIKEHAWRKNLVRELDNAIKRTDDFYIMSEDELKRLVRLIPNISQNTNKSRIARSLQNELRNATCIRVTNRWDVEFLLNWLCDCQGEEPQSIIYHINDADLDD